MNRMNINIDLHSLIDWFCGSRIYDKELCAYRIYYSENENGPIYPEITAYAISLACLLFREYADPRFIERAGKCAEYLINVSPDGLPGHSNNNKYLFDTGIFISSLYDIYDISNDKKYLDEATKRLNWLVKFYDGIKFPALPVSQQTKDHSKLKWEKLSSIHLTKLAIPLIKGSIHSNDERYLKIAEQLLQWGIDLQNEDGRFRINQDYNFTCTHPHCYAVESFIFASRYINEEKYLSIIKKSSDWLAKIQNINGSFCLWYPFYPYRFNWKDILFRRYAIEMRTDTAAQALRIWKFCGNYKKNIDQAERFMCQMVFDNSFILSTRRISGISIRTQKVYSWPAFFYIQSRIMEDGNKSRGAEII